MAKRTPPHNLEPSTTAAQVVTTVNGVATWFGNAVLLIENGATVPADTPIGTIILEKAV
jgi:hypothetical protein